MTPDVFRGRQKQITIRTRAEVEAAIVQHRREAHHTEDRTQFYDCAACGLLEARLGTALEVKTEGQ